MKSIIQLFVLAAIMTMAPALSAQTDCTDYTPVPYSTGFEGLSTGSLPDCWSRPVTGVNNGVTFPSAYSYASNTRTGSVYFEFEASSSSSDFEIAVLPLMQNISDLKLTLWVSNSSNLPGNLEVGVWEDDSVFVPIDTLDIIRFAGTNNWKQNYHQFTVFFNEYSGSGERIALRASRANAGQQYTVFVDDLEVSSATMPEVSLPATLATNILTDLVINATYGGSTSGLYYTWSSTMYDAGDATMSYIDGQLTINYSVAGTDTVTVIAANSYGADTATMIVRALDLSPVTEFPYSTGFEAGEDANWQFTNSSSNAWYIGTAASNSSSNGMYVSNDNGTSNSYSNGGSAVSYAYRPMQFTDLGEYAYSFDWRASGESNYDYIRVWLAPASFEFTANQLPDGSTSMYGYTNTTPSGWIDLGGGKLNQQSGWQTKNGTFLLTAAGSYNLVFMWCNDGSGGSNPPAAIDNIMLMPLTCPSVASVYVDSVGPYDAWLRWPSAGTEADSYDLYYSTYNSLDSATAISGINDTSYNLTGLLPQTTYYAWVRSQCSGDTSFFRQAPSFTTELTCAQLTGVTVSDINYTAAIVNWGYNTTVGFPTSQVEITVVDNTDNTVPPAVTLLSGVTTYTITGLLPSHSYSVTLRNICNTGSQDDTASANTVSFMTTSCSEISGDGATNTYIPTYTYYGNTFSQMIYLASEMPNIDSIRGIAFNILNRNSGNNAARLFDVYVSHTTATAFSSAAFTVVDSTSRYATGVTFNSAATGWQAITFDSAFVYDGHSNLLVTVSDRTGAYGSSVTFECRNASNRGNSIYRDGAGNAYDPTNVPTGTLRNVVPAIRFIADCDVPTCFAPMVQVDSVDSASVSVHWNVIGIENSWLVGIKTASDANYTFLGTVTDTFYTFSGLNANTLYSLYIASLCTDTLPTTVNVRTACGPMALPFFEDWESIPNNGAWPACWDSTMHHNTDPSVNWEYNHTAGGRYSMFLMASGDYNMVVSPAVPLAGDQITVNFWARLNNGTGSWLKAGVITNPHDTSTFIPILTVPDHDAQFHEYEFHTAGLDPSATYHIAWMFYATSTTDRGAIDDISIMQSSPCPRPNQPVVTSVLSDQIGLTFSGSNSSNYMLYITDNAGYTDSVSVVGDTAYTFSGLTPVTTYTIDVRSDCGTSLSYPRTVTATTTLVADSLPYATGFEAADDVAWMLLGGTDANQWYIDSAVASTGSRSLYISSDAGSTNNYSNSSTSNAFAYKLFLFDSVGDYTISYDWRAQGESSFDFIRVALVPASYEFATGSTNGISYSSLPSGWTALDGGSKLNLSSTWQNHSEVFTVNTASAYYILFYWHNDGSMGTNPAGAIDNVQVTRLTCPAPHNDTLTSATTNTISFSWTPAGSESSWEVTFDGVTTIETSTTFVATGLDANTAYNVTVRAICAPGDTSFALNGSFRTTCGDITTFPWIEDFETAGVLECWSQEGDASWTIGTGDYSTSTGSHSGTNNAKITNTSSGNITKLITPVLALTPGSPATLSFWHVQRAWAGDQDSLVVYYRSSMTDSWHRLMGFQNEISSWTKDSVDLPGTSSTYQLAFEMHDEYGYGVAIDDITVDGSGAGSGCTAPTIANVTEDVETITVSFSALGTVDAAIVAGAATTAPTDYVTASGNSHTFSGLQPSTLYTVFLRQHCTDSTVSDWATTTATTLDLGCVPPTGLTIQGTGYTSVILGWTRGNEELAWQVHVFNSTFDSIYTVSTNPVVISGLIPAVTYNASIRALCGANNDLPGEWGADTVTFTTDICPDVEGLVISNITAHSADASWNATTGVSGYSVLWFMDDAEQGNTTVTNPTYHLDNLEAEMPYRVLVKNICAEGAMSEHWTSAEFNTLANGSEGIDDAGGNAFVLHPNPASTAVTVSLIGFAGETTVQIVDINGRIVSESRTSGTELTVDLTSMASGAYIVRVTSSDATAVRRLIVR